MIYETKLLEERPKKKVTPKIKKSGKTVPSVDHPWRKAPTKRPKLYYEEPDSEILAMLSELFGSTRAWA